VDGSNIRERPGRVTLAVASVVLVVLVRRRRGGRPAGLKPKDPKEADYFRHGGILLYVLRQLAAS
jgi:hypothetical protein